MSPFPVVLKNLVPGEKKFFNDRPHVCTETFLLAQVNPDVVKTHVHGISFKPGCASLVVRVPVYVPV